MSKFCASDYPSVSPERDTFPDSTGKMYITIIFHSILLCYGLMSSFHLIKNSHFFHVTFNTTSNPAYFFLSFLLLKALARYYMFSFSYNIFFYLLYSTSIFATTKSIILNIKKKILNKFIVIIIKNDFYRMKQHCRIISMT